MLSSKILLKCGYNGILGLSCIRVEIKGRMSIEYLKCRADLNIEVDFVVNGAIGAIETK